MNISLSMSILVYMYKLKFINISKISLSVETFNYKILLCISWKEDLSSFLLRRGYL